MKADPSPHHLKTLSQVCHNYLVLCSQLTDTVPALLLMRKVVMITTITQQQTPSQATTMVMLPTRSVSTPSMADCSTQGDPDQNNQNNQPIQPCQFNILTTTSFQMEAIGASMTYRTRHFTEAYWKMDIMLILWNFWTSNHYFTPADT